MKVKAHMGSGLDDALAAMALLVTGLAPAEPRRRTLPSPAPLPPHAANGYVAHDGARLYYATFGAGPPVVLLHDGLASGAYWGNQVRPLTAGHHQVILIDSRGHGRSTRDGRPFTYELMASDVIAVLDALNVRRAAVVGWGDGAIIGLVMALKDPERVTRVVAFAANMDPSGLKPDTDTNPTFANFTSHAAANYERISPAPRGFADFEAAINRMWDTEPNYTAADLARIAVPVAIVDGDHDEAIKREHTRYLARSIPRAKLIILRNVSHFAMLQAPVKFNATMLRFIDGRR
jgi:pimeloyl-ACP methyl ester carboxylesterase